MKSFIALIGCLFLTMASFANFPPRLSITNFHNSNLRIVIDGHRYDNFGNSLSLNNLSPGYHNIKVYEINKGFWKTSRLMYSSSVFFRPDHQLDVVINRRGDVSLAERQIGRGNNRNDQYGRNDGYNKGRNNDYGYDRNDDYKNDDNRYRKGGNSRRW